MSQTVTVTDESFLDEVHGSDKPVIVKFWADWCAPCKAMAPIYDELAEKFGDKVKFANAKLDDVANRAVELGVRSLPTLMAFKDGVAVAQHVGNVNRNQLASFVANVAAA